MKHRTYGTGSLYYDPKRDLWIGSLYAGWNQHGNRRRLRVSSRSKTEARRKLDRLRYEYESGTWQPGTQTATLQQLCTTWLQQRANEVRPATYNIETAAITQHILPLLGARRINTLRPSDLKALGNRILEAGKTPATTARYQAVLLRILRNAEKDGLPVPRSILAADKQTIGENTRQAIPLENLLNLVTEAANTPDGVIWLLPLMQGLRAAETLGLRWENINLDQGTLEVAWQLQALPYKIKHDPASGYRIPYGYQTIHLTEAYHLVATKSRSSRRIIPLTPLVAAALARWQETAPQNPWGLLFTNLEGAPISRHAYLRDFKRLQTRLGITKPDGTHYVLHEARHTTATLLLAAKVEPEVIKSILGHSSIVMQATYQHVNLEMAREGLKAAENLLQISR